MGRNVVGYGSSRSPRLRSHSRRGVRAIVRVALAAAGLVSLGVGVLGIFLPLVPTTPFLILAAACFVRSSRRLHGSLMNHRHLGPYIRNYSEHRGLTRGAATATLVLLWVTLGVSAFLTPATMAVRLLLLAVGVGVTIHILSLRRLPGTCADPGGEVVIPHGKDLKEKP